MTCSARSCTPACCPASAATSTAWSPRRSPPAPRSADGRAIVPPSWPPTGGRRASGPRSMAASEQAADAAVAVWAFAEAHRHLEHALSAARPLARRPVPAADRLRLLERAADVAFFAGAGQRSVELVRAAIGSAGPSADPASVAALPPPARPQRVGHRRRRRGLRRLPPGGRARAGRSAVGRARPGDGRRSSWSHAHVAASARPSTAAARRLAVATAVGARLEQGHVLSTLRRAAVARSAATTRASRSPARR